MITKTNINDNVKEIYEGNVEAGWYTDIKTGERLERNIPEMMMLMVSEISESMEAYRKKLSDDKLPQYSGTMTELADLYIRFADLVGYLQTKGFEGDIDQIIYDKRLYNANRADHKLENRKADGGKAF